MVLEIEFRAYLLVSRGMVLCVHSIIHSGEMSAGKWFTHTLIT